MAQNTLAIPTGEPSGPESGAAAPQKAVAPREAFDLKLYLKEVVEEGKRVTWPSSEDWTNSSIITIITILVLGVVMAGLNAVTTYIATMFFGS